MYLPSKLGFLPHYSLHLTVAITPILCLKLQSGHLSLVCQWWDFLGVGHFSGPDIFSIPLLTFSSHFSGSVGHFPSPSALCLATVAFSSLNFFPSLRPGQIRGGTQNSAQTRKGKKDSRQGKKDPRQGKKDPWQGF